MNKKAFAATAASISLVCATMALPGQVSAQAEQAATIIKDGGCFGFVPTASGGFGAFLFTPDGAHAVETSAGTQSLVCHFDIPAGLEPATATRAEGFGCGTYFGFTTESKMVATPGGRATLTCKVNPGQ